MIENLKIMGIIKKCNEFIKEYLKEPKNETKLTKKGINAIKPLTEYFNFETEDGTPINKKNIELLNHKEMKLAIEYALTDIKEQQDGKY